MPVADPERMPSPAGVEASDPDLALLLAEAPAVMAALSPLGRRVRQPASFLPLQSAEARGKRLNATIGQITDGAGRALPLPAMAAALGGLGEGARSQALLYSPVEGLAELRRRWRAEQRRGRPEHLPSSLPLVTAGMAQGRALAADLFAVPGRPVLLGAPVRAADRELFSVRHEAGVVEVAPGGWRAALGELKKGEPALAVLDRLPPGHEEIVAALLEAAEGRPLVALAGGPPEAPDSSLFWALAGRHANLVPLLAEGVLVGVSRPQDLPGPSPEGDLLSGIGFLTFAFAPESGVARVLESKVKMLLRAAVGSPPALLQTLLLAAL